MPKARAVKLRTTAAGRHVSARSKTGDPQCSAAMSAKVNARYGNPVSMALDVANAILGKCRSMARAAKSASSHRSAGREAMAQHIEHRVSAGANRYLTPGQRSARAAELRTQRTKRTQRVGRKPAAPTLRKNIPLERAADLQSPRPTRKAKPVAKVLTGIRAGADAASRERKAVANTKAGKTPEIAFRDQVLSAAQKVPAGKRYGDNKVFIHHVHEKHQAVISNPRMSLPAFKAALADNPHARMHLSRADLIQAMDPEDVRRSNTELKMNGRTAAEWNFVRINPKPTRKR